MRSHFYKRRIITAFPSGNIISIWEKHSAKICCDPEKNLSACTDRDHTSEFMCVQLKLSVILYPEGGVFMKAIRILLSIAMLIAAGLGAFNVIPLRTAYFTLIILVAITVSIRIIHRIAGNGAPNTIVRIISEIIASLCILGFAFFTYRTIG